jgi:excisionase family DNA binding protein
MTDKLLLKRQEAADVANVDVHRIDAWCREPGFPVIRDGSMVRIHRQAFDEWLRARAETTNQIPPRITINAPRTGARRAS